MGEISWTDEEGTERSHAFIIIAGTGFDGMRRNDRLMR